MKKAVVVFMLFLLYFSVLGANTTHGKNTQVESAVNITQLTLNSPTILLKENCMFISGNGMALNTAQINSIVAINNAQGVDTVISSAPGTVIENQDFVNTTISLDSSDNSTIRNNVFRDHYANGKFQSRYIVQVTNSMNITIENNVFNNITNIWNNGFDLMGIYLDTTQDVSISNNTFTNFFGPGMYSTAIYGFGAVGTTITSNTIMNFNASRGVDGIWFEEGDHNVLSNNMVSNILTTGGKAKAFELYTEHDDIFDQNDISSVFANASNGYGYYFQDVFQTKIVQVSDYTSTLPIFSSGVSISNYTDLIFQNTNNTEIQLLVDMNLTIKDTGTYDTFNYSLNAVLQTEGIWQNNYTIFNLSPSPTIDQHLFVFGSTGSKFYFLNTTAFTESVPPVIISSSVSAGTIAIDEGVDLNLSWVLSDQFAGGYNIYVDEVSVSNGNWVNDVPINYTASGLSVGTHNVTAEFSDIFGNVVVYNLDITVNALPTSSTSNTILTTTSSTSNQTTTSKNKGKGFLPINVFVMSLTAGMLVIFQLRRRRYKKLN